VTSKAKVEQERELILNANIRKLLVKFSVPAAIGLVVSALYNVVDTLYVGHALGPLAIAGLAFVLPVQIFIFAVGVMVGTGASSIIARSLGKGDKEKAIITAGNGMILNCIVSILLMIPCYIFIDKIIYFFKVSPEVFHYTKDYMSIILMGFIFLSFSIVGNNLIRAEGKPKAAMYPLIFGAVLNIILAPIFIFVFKMGVSGAAIATVLSQFLSVVYIFIYFNYGKSIFKTHIGMFKINFVVIKDIFKIGFPSFLMSIVDCIIFILFGRTIMKYGSDLYIAIMGISIRVMDITLMPIVGITQGFSTIIGYNYGAKNYERVKKILKEAIIWTTMIAGFAFIIIFGFPNLILRIFSSSREMVTIGIIPIRILSVFFVTIGFQYIGGNLFQSIGKPLPALFLNITRQIIILIPAIIILPMFFGLNGIWFSLPLCDLLNTTLTSILVFNELKLINRLLLKDVPKLA
jgi:putative MATE family efflux protein